MRRALRASGAAAAPGRPSRPRSVGGGAPAAGSGCWELLDEFTSRSFRREAQPLLRTEGGRRRLRGALREAVREGEEAAAAAGARGGGTGAGGGPDQPPVMFGVCASTGAAAAFALDRYIEGLAPAAAPPGSAGGGAGEMELRLIEGVSDVREYALPTFLKYAPGLHLYATPLPGQVRPPLRACVCERARGGDVPPRTRGGGGAHISWPPRGACAIRSAASSCRLGTGRSRTSRWVSSGCRRRGDGGPHSQPRRPDAPPRSRAQSSMRSGTRYVRSLLRS